MRSYGLVGAACLALAAEAIMIPSTMSMPGLTADSLSKHDGKEGPQSQDGDIKALPISSDLLEKLKDLHLGVSKPMPFSLDEDSRFWIHGSQEDTPNDPDADDEEDSSDFSVVLRPFGTTMPQGHEDPEGPHSKDCPSGNSLFAAMCRFRNMVSSKIDHAKPFVTGHRRPCPKKLAAMAKAKAEQLQTPKVHGGLKKFWPHFHAGEDMPVKVWYGNHYFSEQTNPWTIRQSRFQHMLHSFCNGLRRFITGFVIPVLIGVAAGMTASLVGMCVGTLLAFLWIKFVRGGRRGNAGAIVVEEVAFIPEEKDGLLNVESHSEDAPPVYIEKE